MRFAATALEQSINPLPCGYALSDTQLSLCCDSDCDTPLQIDFPFADALPLTFHMRLGTAVLRVWPRVSVSETRMQTLIHECTRCSSDSHV